MNLLWACREDTLLLGGARIKLISGQRQRLAIARTCQQSQMLVMDEATSALDYDTERQLCLNLQSWAKIVPSSSLLIDFRPFVVVKSF